MRLLIIGTLNGQFGTASHIAKKKGAKVRQVSDIESALNSLRMGQGADLIFIEVTADIASLVTQLAEEHIHVPVIACGFEPNKDAASASIHAGAKEYLPLPPDERLIAAILEAITQESAEVLHRSAAMSKVVTLAEQVAASDATILITGESGTGKEVISHYIHEKSKRAAHAFISVNCAAIPENLMESELFGHEKGAFTGALARRIGKFEESHNGTILLDEISEIDLRLQAKLLRVLQEREVDRVGGSGKPIKLNLRVIATSNRDLRKEVAAGRFREDLFFRLNIINLHLPPLRDRSEDLLLLAEYFVKKYSINNQIAIKPFAKETLEQMLHYRWPGNVRELENTMHRAVLLTTGNEITPEALMLPLEGEIHERLQVTGGSALIGRTFESVEKELILGTLEHCLGDSTHAANILGISIRLLRDKLERYQSGSS